MYKLYIETDSLPQSLNKKLKWSAKFKNLSENRRWDMLIATLVSQKKRPIEPLSRAKISIVRHSYRMLDFDGCVGSLKPVVDAFVSCGVLHDDSWVVVGAWDVNQRFRPKKDGPLLEILIQEMPVK